MSMSVYYTRSFAGTYWIGCVKVVDEIIGGFQKVLLIDNRILALLAFP
jgi:hypothetical protein